MSEANQPLDLSEAARLPNAAEAVFACFAILCGFRIYHEPHRFTDPELGGTTPDFLVEKPGDPKQSTFVEITTGSLNSTHKRKQREVMERRGNRYVQFGRPQIESMRTVIEGNEQIQVAGPTTYDDSL